MRFILKTGIGSVSTFTTCDGKIHVPGDVVDLPPAYKGEAWLQPVDIEPKPVMLKAVEKAEPTVEKIGPGPEHIVAKPEKPLPSKPHK